VATNRHPADRLAEVRIEIRRLEGEEQELRGYLLEHPDDLVGEELIASIGSQDRRHVDLKALADEVGRSVLTRFTRIQRTTCVRLRERSQ